MNGDIDATGGNLAADAVAADNDHSFTEAAARTMADHYATVYQQLLARGVPQPYALAITQQHIAAMHAMGTMQAIERARREGHGPEKMGGGT